MGAAERSRFVEASQIGSMLFVDLARVDKGACSSHYPGVKMT